MKLGNKHLQDLDRDVLFHLGYELPADIETVRRLFGNVRYVLMGGSPGRAHLLIREYAKRLQQADILMNVEKEDLDKDWCLSERYHIYKCGQVISLAHGIGAGSILVALHEIAKALHYADASNVTWIRTGSSGGLGVEPGTVVVTSEPLNGIFEPYIDFSVLGKTVRHEASFDSNLSAALLQHGKGMLGDGCLMGKTMSCYDFYETQGRRDGALCDFEIHEQDEFFAKAKARGVCNFEMESLALASFTRRAGISAACVCAVLVNRMQEDTVHASPQKVKEWEKRPVILVVDWVFKQLHRQPEVPNGK